MTPVRHPAKFTDSILDQMGAYLLPGMKILDPFAGTGKVHLLADRAGCESIGIEIEPEWATLHPRTVQGDALALPFPDGEFDAVVTSPTYGNRMADCHEAKDPCRECRGRTLYEGAPVCRACGGSGLSRRNTYTHALGRRLHGNNSGALQWGTRYRDFHREAWAEVLRVLAPGGLFLLNVKDHVRAGRVVPVSTWHRAECQKLGFIHVRTLEVPVRGNRQGANGSARVDFEEIHVMLKPNDGMGRD